MIGAGIVTYGSHNEEKRRKGTKLNNNQDDSKDEKKNENVSQSLILKDVEIKLVNTNKVEGEGEGEVKEVNEEILLRDEVNSI